jgi:hypothetical protein
MTALSKREYHETNAEEQRAIVVKIFGTMYVNMAFVVLFAYGYLHRKPKVMEEVSHEIIHGIFMFFRHRF